MSLPGGSDGKTSAYNAGDPASIPGSKTIPWRRAWKHTLVFLPVESHGLRSLVGYSPWGCKELDTTERLSFFLSFSLISESEGYFIVAACGFLSVMASFCKALALGHMRLSCSAACGIFLDQGLNPCPLRWQVGS